MKIEIPNVGVMYPDENQSIDRTISIEADFEYLQINFLNQSDINSGCMTLNKSQMIQLRDSLNLIIKNKLIE